MTTIVFHSETVATSVVLSAGAAAHISAHRQTRPERLEAGGQLFGDLTADGDWLVDAATGPHQTDRRSRYGFCADQVLAQQDIHEHYVRGLHYLGDWHTHPECWPAPSALDIRSMQETFSRSRHEMPGFLLVIVGIAGTYAAVVDATSLREIDITHA